MAMTATRQPISDSSAWSSDDLAGSDEWVWTLDPAEIEELDFQKVLAEVSLEEESPSQKVVKCGDCGAESTLDPNVTSDECPFCGSPVVVQEGSEKKIRPKSLLPFKVEQKEAGDLFRKWLVGLWFAPNKLKHLARRDKPLDGMYIPYWTYDSNTTSYYTGERGVDYYTTETYTDSEGNTRTRQVRRTRWYSVSGCVWNSFDDVLVLASNSLPRKYADELEPWDLKNLTGYSEDYLPGFRTESYQVDLEEGFGRAKEIMDSSIRSSIRRDIGGDHQRIHSVSTQYDDITFKHILLPIWISAYRYNQKPYRFLVNGRTGEVQGERP
ncbi:MAG: hypothetical protein QF645_13495, partial [Planctomycetota bacterium]|nr:hypothetical protein [Planctomycetota bacterium]